jgi:hypothetical protein
LQTRVSKAFIRDFAQCANHFNWNQADIDEMKTAVREGNGMREYIEKLAAAQRAGYVQTRENGFMRLSEWSAE